uniref:Uncharacterized protein n=1 Tax=Romanomermis culicivorax TaxID=13658 RepID=A0A915KBI7_ROMCU
GGTSLREFSLSKALFHRIFRTTLTPIELTVSSIDNMYGVSMKMMLALTAFVVLGEAQNPPPNILIGAPAHQVQGR